MHNATDRPNRSAGPRPRPGSTNATSAGANVKNRNNSSRPISGNPRSRSSSSSTNTCVATATSPERGPDPQLRRLPSHIRPILGEYYGDPILGKGSSADNTGTIEIGLDPGTSSVRTKRSTSS